MGQAGLVNDRDTPLYRYRFGSAEFDEAKMELRVGGVPMELEQKPMLVLLQLLRNINEVVTRQELFANVWDGRPTVEHVLNNAISKLRSVLGEVDGDCIVTVPRSGYKLACQVERIAVGRRLSSQLALSSGETISGTDFVLHEQLGSSRGNEVWVAKHASTQERCVFKFCVDGEHLTALKREVTLYRLLAESVDTPDDFVRIVDWNFENSPFYLRLDYAGDNLIAWSKRDGTLQALTLAQRVELFLQIADAIAAAHSVGVLHKDIKPSNVLIMPRDGGWQTRIVDFGSGRLLEPERLDELSITKLSMTLTQNMSADSARGTPLYIAPELIAGHAPTIQSDLYALGLLLYQLSIGDLRKPMASGWEVDIDDALLCADIAAATAGDPKRRFATVIELTTRLRTRDARRDALTQSALTEQRALAAEKQLERARARKPWLITAAASLVLASAISLWMYNSANKARQESEQNHAHLQAVNNLLNEVIRDADPSAPGATRNLSVKEMLASAADKAAHRFKDDPLTKASIDLSLGETYFGLSDYVAAIRYQQEATDLLNKVQGTDSSTALEAQYALARSLIMNSQYTEARAILIQADRFAGNRLQQDTQLALIAHWTKGSLALIDLDPETAMPEFSSALRIQQLIEPADEVWSIRLRTNLAWCRVQLQQYAQAIPELKDLMKHSSQFVGMPTWVKIRTQYTLALVSSGNFAEAEQVMQATLKETKQTLGPDHYLVGLAWSYVAIIRREAKQWDLALDAARQALTNFHTSVGDDNQATQIELVDIGAIAYLSGKSHDALPQLRKALLSLQASGERSAATQYATFYVAAASAADNDSLREATKLVATLQPKALASVYPIGNWQDRLQRLQSEINTKLPQQDNARKPNEIK